MTVLIVDDEPVVLRLLQITLERHRYSVAPVASAGEALEWLEQVRPVEMVITDQRLGAGMSGLELFSALRSDLRWRGLPVILCTGAADRPTVEEAMRRGLRYFVVKPVTADRLIEKVNRARADYPPIMQDRFEGMARLGWSEAGYTNLMKASSERLAELRVQLAATSTGEDRRQVKRVAERIRESAGVLGAQRCLAALSEVESGPDGSDPRLAVALLAQELATLEEALVAAVKQLPVEVSG